MNIEIACAERGELDDCEITQWELDLALSHGKSSSPGEDGITYQVIRLLNHKTKNGNPILTLLNLSLKEGVLPKQWTFSVIIPIPKPNSNKLRPISLTSCLCKVLERIILNRIRFILGDKLYNNLYGFMPGKSTRDCFAKFMATDDSNKVTTFIDLQSAFDVANRTAILDHLSKLGINGTLLTWIRGYLSNRYSKVYYKGYLTSEEKLMELGTPQGGVLSPFLFNVLMDKLLTNVELKPSDEVICYADDICFKSSTMNDMQLLLDQFF